jgi:hypothetical protein
MTRTKRADVARTRRELATTAFAAGRNCEKGEAP